ncbi:MAG: V-type ATP synthase subunit I [Phycisphaerae bacterium]|jgi:V/A-type H+-transporting ATPase subunit I
MAISSMAKILIACHKSQVSELLEELQQSGICQILNAEEAMVSKHYPDLATAGERPRQLEEKLNLISKNISFLREYADRPKGLAAALAPKIEIDENKYKSVIADKNIDELLKAASQVESKIDKIQSEIENINGRLEKLRPWEELDVPLPELSNLGKAVCIAGLLPANKLVEVETKLLELGAAVEQVGTSGMQFAVLVVCMKDAAGEVQKTLRSADFESASFEGLNGTAAELIAQSQSKLQQLYSELDLHKAKAKTLARDYEKLEILHDYYANLLNREQTENDSPATERTVILESWVRTKNYKKLEQIVGSFDAANISQIVPAENEEIPVEIENKRLFRPFEVVTRLYGMPQHYNLDPTVFLAPFFAIFFGMCIADAGYGLLMLVLLAFFIVKMQGDKKLLYMLALCAVAVVIIGALTGGWFGDGVQKFIPTLGPVREKMMWFDPFKNPMLFFGLAVGLGYFQLITGLVIAFFHNIRKKDFVAAVCDQLTWIVMLNSIVLLGAAKGGFIPANLARIFGFTAIIPAVMIFLFSHREGGIGARLGMGFYNIFSSVFYLGDVLSYLRLMALGMVGAGLAMAINVIAQISGNIPYVGIIVTIVILVFGHIFNLLLAILSAFVHTLRLQYVEFFPKFLVGGGKEFKPLTKQYDYIYFDNKNE